MKELNELKKQAELLENKAWIYFNELGDENAYNRVKNELDKVNSAIIDLMTFEQEKQRKEAIV